MWWYVRVIPAFERLKQDDRKFKVLLGYIETKIGDGDVASQSEDVDTICLSVLQGSSSLPKLSPDPWPPGPDLCTEARAGACLGFLLWVSSLCLLELQSLLGEMGAELQACGGE